MDAWKLVSRTWGSCGCWQYKVVLIFSIGSVFFTGACQSTKPGTSPGDLVGGTSQQGATLTYPTASNSIDPFTPFTWKPFAGALGYYVDVGTTPGGRDVYTFGEMPPGVTSWTVDNLLPGQTYYARLYTHTATGWPYVDVKFQTTQVAAASGTTATLQNTVQTFTAAIRNSADFYNAPTAGTPLAAELASLNRTNASCTDFALTLMQQLQQQKIYSRIVILSLVGNFWLGHSVVEYYDPFAQAWWVADPTFGAVYYDPASQLGQSAAELSQYVQAEAFSSVHIQFVTSNGDGYMRSYYLDPITLYLNVVPAGSTVQQSVANDPHQFLIPVLPSSSIPHGAYVVEFGSTGESLGVDNPPGPYSPEPTSITVTPQDSTVWSRAYWLNDGWSLVSAPSDAKVFSFRRVLF